MSLLRDAAHFVRWRFIPLRYAGKLRGWRAPRRDATPPASRNALARQVVEHGYASGPRIPPRQLTQLQERFAPRAAAVKPRERGHPFVNLLGAEDLVPECAALQLAFSPQVFDVARDYFDGRLILDSIQVLYSWPTSGPLQASQMWHKDYGDWRSFHWIAYLNDVEGPDDGPFCFVDRNDTRRIRRSPFIRRISDERFNAELGAGTLRSFLGRAGDSVFVDPSACYHNGSRCRRQPRLALFVTFNTCNPFVAPVPLVREQRAALRRAARELRPDLTEHSLDQLLQLR
jgi:hypothetical protein